MVNVTIVDFRGVDTMFEITVFGIAALGVANLVAAAPAGRRRLGGDRVASARIGAESMIFEQVMRMIFHLTLLVSVYVCCAATTRRAAGSPAG